MIVRDYIPKNLHELTPTLVASSVEALSPEALEQLGLDIQLVLYDVDGTLMPYHDRQFPPEVVEMLNRMGSKAEQLLLSNAYDGRVEKLHEIVKQPGLETEVGVLAPALIAQNGDNPKRYRKPTPAMPLHIMRERGIEPQNVLMVGDQMYKDVFSARRALVHSLLVRRVGRGDDPKVKYMQRPLELLAKRRLNKKRKLPIPILARNFPKELTEIS